MADETTAGIQPAAVPQPEWVPLPSESARGVEGKVLLLSDDLVVAMLRFAVDAFVEEPAGGADTEVICLAGGGFISAGEDRAPIARGQRTSWPGGAERRLWTLESEMLTLMIERRAR